MVENSGAKNEVGKLFVDIGIGGLGKALKSLNSVSASFLLGKNAAMQFAQTISQPFKEAGKGAIEIGKMSNALATTGLEFQKLSLYLKNHGLSDALLGDVSNLQKTFLALRKNQQNMSDSWRRGFAEAHLDPMEFEGTFEGAMKFLDALQKKTSNMSKENRNFLLDLFGINNDWGYLWDQGGRASDYLTIPDADVKKLQSMQEAINAAKNTLNTLMTTYLAKMAPALETIANWITQKTTAFEKNGGITKAANATIESVKTIAPNNAIEATSLLLPGVGINNAVRGAVKGWKSKSTPGSAAPLVPINEDITGSAAPLVPIDEDITEGAALPPNLSNMTQSITNNITHEITINGDNANQIANKIAGLSAQDIQYSQYQANNMPGI